VIELLSIDRVNEQRVGVDLGLADLVYAESHTLNSEVSPEWMPEFAFRNLVMCMYRKRTGTQNHKS